MTSGRRGRPSVAAVKSTSASILSAALQVFASKGFVGSSFVEIAELAGVTRRTLYARYPNKEALLTDVVRELIDERLALDERCDGTSANQILLDIAADITVRSPSAPLLMRIIIAEGANFSHGDMPLGRAGRDHLLDQMKLVFENLMERGLLPRADAHEAAVLFTDMVIASGMLSLLTFATEGTVEDLLAPRVAFFCTGFSSWADENRTDNG